MADLRVLVPGEEEVLEAFLRPRTETSMFLRGNLRAAGLGDAGEPLQGTYVAAFSGDSITAVAAHYWNGMLILQAPGHLVEVAREAARASGRPLRGIGGPWDQVVAARRALDREHAATNLCSREDLYFLELQDLRVPPALERGEVTCRAPRRVDLELLARWHVEYCVEALGAEESRALHDRCSQEMRRLQESAIHWVLVRDDEPVSYTAFNAHLPDCVQIGGVWTPPPLRGNGYARCVVAGQLLAARATGVERSILFTGEGNEPARRAYQSIGYRIVGDYGLIDFTEGHPYSPGDRG